MKTFIITGLREGGKTYYMEQLCSSLTRKGYPCEGFLSSGSYNPDGSKEFFLCPLNNSKNHHLASPKPKPGYMHIGNYHFNPATVKTGEKIIDKALNNKPELIALDEIGPGELREEIWFSPLKKVLQKNHSIVLISVREKLIFPVIKKFSITDYTVLDINIHPLEYAENQIITSLENKPG